MRDKQVEAKFLDVLKANEKAAIAARASREAYRVAWARAYVSSSEKTDTARKALADVTTTDLRAQRDLDQIELDTTYHKLMFYRGPEVITRPGEE